jgi:hypothetical protein
MTLNCDELEKYFKKKRKKIEFKFLSSHFTFSLFLQNETSLLYI